MQKTYDRQTAQFLAVIGQNIPELSSDVMQKWIENPEDLQMSLRTALCPPKTAALFKVWKTIKLGTGLKTADDFRVALKKVGMKISNDILDQPVFTASESEREVDLVNVSVLELGFKRGATRCDIITRALSLGLELCPIEVGPQLRLQYPDQPKDEWFVIGMEPVTDSDGYLEIFNVDHSGGSPGYPDVIWDARDHFVFLRPRN